MTASNLQYHYALRARVHPIELKTVVCPRCGSEAIASHLGWGVTLFVCNNHPSFQVPDEALEPPALDMEAAAIAIEDDLYTDAIRTREFSRS